MKNNYISSILDTILNRKPDLLVATLVFLFPILMATVTNSVVFIQLLLLVLGCWLFLKKFTLQLTQTEKIIFKGFVIIFIVYFLGMLNSDDLYNGYKKLGKFSYFLLAIPIYSALNKYQKFTLKALYLGLIISGPVLLIYLLQSEVKLGATGAYHSIIYGDFSMLLVGISILFSFSNNIARIYKILLIVSALCALGASFGVGARGSWLALLLLLAIFLYIFITQKYLRTKIIIIFLSLILTTTVSSIIFPKAVGARFNAAIINITQFINSKHSNNKQQSTSSGTRFMLWSNSIATFKKYPLFGTGSGDFNAELLMFIKKNPQYVLMKNNFDSAHNIFFEWLALFGIVGFMILITTVFLLPLRFFIQIINNNPDQLWYGIIGIWIVLSSVIFGLTESWIVRSAPNGVYVFFVLLFMSFVNKKNIR